MNWRSELRCTKGEEWACRKWTLIDTSVFYMSAWVPNRHEAVSPVDKTTLPERRHGYTRVPTKGVGPSTTLAWVGWKQPDIPVEVDTARLEASRTEGAAGLFFTELSIWEFSFLRGSCRQGGIVYDIVWMGDPRRTPWTVLRTPVSYRRLSSQFQFSLSAVTLVYLSQWHRPCSPYMICVMMYSTVEYKCFKTHI